MSILAKNQRFAPLGGISDRALLLRLLQQLDRMSSNYSTKEEDPDLWKGFVEIAELAGLSVPCACCGGQGEIRKWWTPATFAGPYESGYCDFPCMREHRNHITESCPECLGGGVVLP